MTTLETLSKWRKLGVIILAGTTVAVVGEVTGLASKPEVPAPAPVAEVAPAPVAPETDTEGWQQKKQRLTYEYAVNRFDKCWPEGADKPLNPCP